VGPRSGTRGSPTRGGLLPVRVPAAGAAARAGGSALSPHVSPSGGTRPAARGHASARGETSFEFAIPMGGAGGGGDGGAAALAGIAALGLGALLKLSGGGPSTLSSLAPPPPPPPPTPTPVSPSPADAAAAAAAAMAAAVMAGAISAAVEAAERLPTLPSAAARYVRIVAPGDAGDHYLQISQLLVFDAAGVNVARGRPCAASSGYCAKSGDPRLATSSGAARAARHPDAFHSALASGDWWEVDLGGVIDVSRVVYYNRGEAGLTQRIVGAVLQLLGPDRCVVSQATFTDASTSAPYTETFLWAGPLPGGGARTFIGEGPFGSPSTRRSPS
jgi:hypothetical protein